MQGGERGRDLVEALVELADGGRARGATGGTGATAGTTAARRRGSAGTARRVSRVGLEVELGGQRLHAAAVLPQRTRAVAGPA